MKKWICLLTGLMLASPLFATIVVEEHFINLAGTGSTGIASWPKGTITDGLSWPGVVSSGGGLTGATTFGCIAGYNGTAYGDSTTWFSVMVKNTANQDRLLFWSTTGSSSAGAGIDCTGNGVRADISNTMGATTVPIISTNVCFIVGKMELSSTGNETVTIWVNPTNFTSEAAMIASAAGSSTVTAAGVITATAASTIWARMGGTTTVFDEIRLATTLAEVTPSPIQPYPVLTDVGILPSRTNLLTTGNSIDLFSMIYNDNGSMATGVTVTVNNIPSGFTVSNAVNSEYGTVNTSESKTNTTPFHINAPLSSPLGTPNNFGFQISGYSAAGVRYTTNSTFSVILKQAVNVTGQDGINRFSMVADNNMTDTNALMTISNSSDSALICNLTENASWLTLPGGNTLTVAPHSASNVTLVAGPISTSGQYTTPLTVSYNQTVTNFTSFTVQFDVGAKIEPLTANAVISEAGGINLIPGKYEPGEILNITIPSINNGAIMVGSTTNTLTLPSGWDTPTPASAVYSSMVVGSTTSTTYQITIPGGATDGNYTLTAKNASAGGFFWTGDLTLNVYKRAAPSVSTTNLTITVPAGGTATGVITLTNAGNNSTTFALTDNGSWASTYSVSTQTVSLVPFEPIYDAPDTNTTFVSWNTTDTALMNIGFSFPLYGTAYTTFSVSKYGAVGFGASVGANTDTPPSLPSGTTPAIAAFWGSSAVSTNSVRYMKQTDKLVVSWGNRTGHEFQAWLYTNGAIRYVYQSGSWSGGVIGIQSGSNALTAAYTPSSGSESLLLTPKSLPWVTPDPASGNLSGPGYQDITFTANAINQVNGTTNNFTATATWGDGSTSQVNIKVVVATTHLGLSAPTNVPFTGLAGFITKTNMLLVNTGDVATAYTITDIGAQAAGYTYTNVVYDWEDSTTSTDSGISGVLFKGVGNNEAVSELIPIGFNFPFYGAVYTQLSIGKNGAISLGESSLMTKQYNYTDGASYNIQYFYVTNTLSTMGPVSNGHPSQSPSIVGLPSQMIAPYWQSWLSDSTSCIRYSGNDNRFVVTWENMYQADGGANQTFQAVLYKNGTIRFQYYHISGSTWPFAEIGLRDTGSRTKKASLAFAGAPYDGASGNMMVVTNLQGYYTTNYDARTFVVTNTVVSTNYSEVVTGEAILFTPAAGSSVITVYPVSGTLPVGGSTNITIYGDARSLTSGGTNDVFASTIFGINYPGYVPGTNITTNVVGGVTNITTNTVIGTVSSPVSVMFLATNSTTTAFPGLLADSNGDGYTDLNELMFGSDGVVTVTQGADGSRTLSWPKPNDNISRTYTVWYTSDLMSGWTWLADLPDGYSYRDAAHADFPVIYYRVTVQ